MKAGRTNVDAERVGGWRRRSRELRMIGQRRLVGLIATIATLAACGGGPVYRVQHQATPNPFTRPGCKARVESMKLSTASLSEDERKAVSKAFEDGVEQGAEVIFSGTADPSNVFTLAPTIGHWEKAETNISVGALTVIVRILDSSGHELDRIIVDGHTSAWTDQLDTAAAVAGQKTLLYMKDRWECARGI